MIIVHVMYVSLTSLLLHVGAPKGTAGGKKRKTAETKISKAKPRKGDYG